MAFPVAAALMAGGSIASGIMSSNAAAKAAEQQAAAQRYAAELAAAVQREQLAEQKRQFGEQQEAYENVLGRGTQQFGTGETAFLSQAQQASPELAQMKEDILSGQARGLQQASGQLQAGLAQQGVRGGQAATQLRRGLGEMGVSTQENINKLAADEAQQRKAQLMAYQQAKAQMGQQATLSRL